MFRMVKVFFNFQYNGEVDVCQKDLKLFLSLAEELNISGLTKNSEYASSNSFNAQTKREKLEEGGTSLTKSPLASTAVKRMEDTTDVDRSCRRRTQATFSDLPTGIAGKEGKLCFVVK